MNHAATAAPLASSTLVGGADVKLVIEEAKVAARGEMLALRAEIEASESAKYKKLYQELKTEAAIRETAILEVKAMLQEASRQFVRLQEAASGNRVCSSPRPADFKAPVTPRTSAALNDQFSHQERWLEDSFNQHSENLQKMRAALFREVEMKMDSLEQQWLEDAFDQQVRQFAELQRRAEERAPARVATLETLLEDHHLPIPVLSQLPERYSKFEKRFEEAQTVSARERNDLHASHSSLQDLLRKEQGTRKTEIETLRGVVDDLKVSQKRQNDLSHSTEASIRNELNTLAVEQRTVSQKIQDPLRTDLPLTAWPVSPWTRPGIRTASSSLLHSPMSSPLLHSHRMSSALEASDASYQGCPALAPASAR